MSKWYKIIEKYGFLRHVYNFLQYQKNKLSTDFKQNNKVFVIGLNKTGTTSIEQSLIDLGYKIGNQVDAELLSEYVLNGNCKYFYEYLKTANAFQDQPFSFRENYRLIHEKYPDAKFILTIRKDSDTWYKSLESFTKKRFINDGIDIADKLIIKDIKKLNYRYPQMPYRIMKKLWLRDRHVLLDEDYLFDEDYCKYYYNKHIKEVKKYFSENSNLLILNIEEQGSYEKFCKFLVKEPLYNEFPHKNRT